VADNVSTLKQHGLIHHEAKLSAEDEKTVNGLSDDEVKALVSIKKKLPHGFIQRHTGVDSPEASASRTVGIVF
jgi:hypothetical protein